MMNANTGGFLVLKNLTQQAFAAVAMSVLIAGEVFAQAPAVDAPAKDTRPSWIIAKDEPISPQLITFAKTHGWSLLWDAQEYAVPVGIQIFGDPETVVTYLLDGARNAGVNLTGVIHSNIKTIHITE